MIQRTKELGMPAVAITDHGTMYGVVEFYDACKKEGVHPVIGLEGYITPRRMDQRDPQKDKRSNHILMLAENMAGYQNLLKIASTASWKGSSIIRAIDHEYLLNMPKGSFAPALVSKG